MTEADLTADQARRELYEIMREDTTFEDKINRALDLGKTYLGVDNAHLTRISPEANYWEAIASTDSGDGDFPPGLLLDAQTTYCRRTLAQNDSIALHDATDQGWADDPAFEEHGLHCYHGTPIHVDGDPYGTVCFVSRTPRDAPFDNDDTLFAELVARLIEHELERELHEAETTRRSNSITVLSRVLRHNLRNEMTVVRGRISHLVDQLDDATYVTDAVFDSIDRVIGLSDKARKLETVVSTDYDREFVALAPLLERIQTAVSLDYPDAAITTDVPGDVSADLKPSFELAVTELVENAAAHAGPSPNITVSVGETPGGLTVTVADDGPGLPSQEQAVLAEGVETPLVHGSGLGLWMVYWIVTSHDGTIDATATGKGTTITLRIPRVTTTEDSRTYEEVPALQRGMDRFEAVFEESFDAMVIVDDDRRIIDANDHAAELFDTVKADLLGRTLGTFAVETFDVDGVWMELQGTGRYEGQIPTKLADGTERVIEVSATADIVPGQHLFVGRDITDRIEREQALTHAKERLDAIFNNTNTFIGLLDPDGTLVEVNETALEFGGITREAVVGQPLWETSWFQTSEATTAAVRAAIDQAQNGDPFREELQVQGADGEAVVDFTVNPVVNDSGEVTMLVPEGRDITERKQAEETLRTERDRFEQLLETTPAGVTILDTDGSITRANERAETILGLSESAITGRTYDDPAWDIVDEDGEPIPAEELPFAQVMASGEPVYGYEHGIVWPDGTERWLAINAAPLTDRDGTIREVIAVIIDVSDRRAHERALERQTERSAAFASIVSHDLRNPLNVAQGHLEEARAERDSEHLAAVAESHDRMRVLIEDLLRLARADESVGDTEPVELQALVEGCWAGVDTADATLECDLSRRIESDESRLRQVFENLFRNAVEHGGPTVRVTVGELADGFYVEDDGAGISADAVDAVFETGYSAHAEGTGVGLSIVEEIVEAHGWQIRIADGSDGGARFEVTGVEWAAE